MAAMLPFIVMIAPKARSPHHVAVRVPSKPDAVAGASRLATICRTGNSRYPHGFRPIRSRAVPEAYGMKDVDDFIFLLIRTPAFSEKVNDIAVECGNSLYQLGLRPLHSWRGCTIHGLVVLRHTLRTSVLNSYLCRAEFLGSDP